MESDSCFLLQFRDNSKLKCKKTGVKRSEPVRKPKRPLSELNVDTATHGSILGARRKSARLQGQVCIVVNDLM